ncbi:hypothetical protein Ae201684P_010769 [Aphanomyces euteiches]|nr:hypothetical protein Ae201684P_010769 [Aphanomyces euteiches]
MAILIVNMVYFAPRLVRQLALVNATVRVDPNELKTSTRWAVDELSTHRNDAASTLWAVDGMSLLLNCSEVVHSIQHVDVRGD